MFSELWIKAETLIACSRTGEISKPVEKLDPFICIPVHKQEWIGIFFFSNHLGWFSKLSKIKRYLCYFYPSVKCKPKIANQQKYEIHQRIYYLRGKRSSIPKEFSIRWATKTCKKISSFDKVHNSIRISAAFTAIKEEGKNQTAYFQFFFNMHVSDETDQTDVVGPSDLSSGNRTAIKSKWNWSLTKVK